MKPTKTHVLSESREDAVECGKSKRLGIFRSPGFFLITEEISNCNLCHTDSHLVTLVKSLQLLVPQFPHLQNGGNMSSTYLKGVV